MVLGEASVSVEAGVDGYVLKTFASTTLADRLLEVTQG